MAATTCISLFCVQLTDKASPLLPPKVIIDVVTAKPQIYIADHVDYSRKSDVTYFSPFQHKYTYLYTDTRYCYHHPRDFLFQSFIHLILPENNKKGSAYI